MISILLSYFLIPPCGLVSVVSKPEKIEYNLGDELDLTGLTVSLLYPSNISYDYNKLNVKFDIKTALESVSPEDYPEYFKIDSSKFDSSKPGTYEINIYAVDKAQEFYNYAFLHGSFKVTVTDKITGDANGDNAINILDAAYIAKKIAGRKSNDLSEWADYNGDKLINIIDAASIARDVANGKLKQ